MQVRNEPIGFFKLRTDIKKRTEILYFNFNKKIKVSKHT